MPGLCLKLAEIYGSKVGEKRKNPTLAIDLGALGLSDRPKTLSGLFSHKNEQFGTKKSSKSQNSIFVKKSHDTPPFEFFLSTFCPKSRPK